MNLHLLKSTLALTALIYLTSCAKDTKHPKEELKPKSLQIIRIAEPSNGKLFATGENIDVNLKLLNDSVVADSIILFVDSQNFGKFNGTSKTIETTYLKLGTRQVRATAWLNGNRQTASVGIMIKPSIAPKKLSYRIVNTFPHDANAYTQGLFYHNGYLIEGTGQHGESTLRKVELKTGKVLKSSSLESKYFGEGCALINEKIYQLTWRSHKGFIYEAETFNPIGTFEYPTQGWGLTASSTQLIMSDGSNNIYFIEPENFAEVKRIEVYDNNGPVNELNELEYIDGKIWANVYQTDRIVVISPETGMVESEIDFKGLLKQSDMNSNTDVLNGIAWDSENRRLFVTGKNWPKLFEVVVK